MNILGIDPGKSGGLACMDGTGRFELCNMPDSERELADILLRWTEGHQSFAYVERLSPMPMFPQGTNFKLGRNQGVILGALAALCIPFELVTAAKWQKGCGYVRSAAKGNDPQHKRDLKAHALRLFPDSGATLKTCDALLIAEHGRRLETRGTEHD